jgi:hypothetical protein
METTTTTTAITITRTVTTTIVNQKIYSPTATKNPFFLNGGGNYTSLDSISALTINYIVRNFIVQK